MLKKVLGLTAFCTLAFVACRKSAEPILLMEQTNPAEQLGTTTQLRTCASYEVLQQQLKDDPTLQARMDEIEAFTNQYVKQVQAGTNKLVSGNLIVPVVVNVIYRVDSENVSNEQIYSQIDVLNEDYGATNNDLNAPSLFSAVLAGDVKVRFTLDPSDIKRKVTNKLSWTTNNAVKSTKQGGLDPTSPTTKLNIWVCNLGGGVLGYAQFPGGSSSTDGVVIDNNAFGKGFPRLYADYNLGRTATHEVGHWFNLRHIWGDATCGTDLVGDTPQHNTANYKCPVAGHKSTCAGTPVEMTMNFMDYTYDRCMYMFSLGQAKRMQATWAESKGGRYTFVP